MSSLPKIMLIACGSFNPPTPMHFRMFEIARDHFHQLGIYDVIGGIISPVHDAYGKNGLAPAIHRLAMVKIGLQTSDWIRLSEWETQQKQWSRTRTVLEHHQNFLNSYLKEVNGTVNSNFIPGWIPDNIKSLTDSVQVKLLCGADLLESFATPGLWKDEDLEAILAHHGIVVVSRSGSDAERFVYESDQLNRHRSHITLATNWVVNEVSSTLIRRFIRRGWSVKYLLDDRITEYIRRNRLYGMGDPKYILTPNQNQINFVEKQNRRNAKPVPVASDGEDEEEEEESMDETDSRPPKRAPRRSNTVAKRASAAADKKKNTAAVPVKRLRRRRKAAAAAASTSR